MPCPTPVIVAKTLAAMPQEIRATLPPTAGAKTDDSEIGVPVSLSRLKLVDLELAQRH